MKHEQCQEKERLQIQNHEDVITKISGEASEAIERSQAENNELKLKLEKLEDNIQYLEEERLVKKNKIIEMGEKIQDVLNENSKLQKENLTLEGKQKELEEKEEIILSLHNANESLTNQLDLLEGQEKNIKLKFENASQEKLKLEEVKILTIGTSFYNMSFSSLPLKRGS